MIQSIDKCWCEHSARAHSAYAAGFLWSPLRRILLRARTACRRRHHEIDSNSYKPLTRQEARRRPRGNAIDDFFKGLGVHSAQKCQETGGGDARRGNAPPDTRARPKAPRSAFVALSQRLSLKLQTERENTDKNCPKARKLGHFTCRMSISTSNLNYAVGLLNRICTPLYYNRGVMQIRISESLVLFNRPGFCPFLSLLVLNNSAM